MNAQEILRAGKVQLRVRHVGIWQFREFVVKRVGTPIGSYPVLYLDKFLDASECMRVAEETGLPVQTLNGVFFPKGKSAKDFVGL
ncbi:MAG: hypothetical protein QXG98_03315 [Candidatus Micrarchaeia archaeon]